MADIKALKQFIDGLHGDRLFNTGVVGATSPIQHQTNELRRAFAHLQAQPKDEQTKEAFESSLLAAHAVSVITDDELHKCEIWLEDK